MVDVVKNEVVRRFFWAFENDSDAFQDLCHPEMEWYTIEDNRTLFYGVEGAMRSRNTWLDTWDEHRLDVEEAIEDGDDVVVLVHITARGKTSGAKVDVRFYAQVKVRDGKVAYIYDHEDRAAAVEAAGLPG